MAGKRRRQAEPADRTQVGLDVLALVSRVLESPQLKKTEALGGFVVVNIETGDFVFDRNLMDANTCFMESFPGATGFAHRVGEPLFLDHYTKSG